jgi:hypothetical protein
MLKSPGKEYKNIAHPSSAVASRLYPYDPTISQTVQAKTAVFAAARLLNMC